MTGFRGFRLVAAPAATSGLLLELAGGLQQKPRCGSARHTNSAHVARQPPE
jgi:hypothetical protein